jgi:hypothetical protein
MRITSMDSIRRIDVDKFLRKRDSKTKVSKEPKRKKGAPEFDFTLKTG